MRKLKNEQLSAEQKAEIIHFYKKHSRPATCKKFSICYKVLERILLEAGIEKHSQVEGNFLAKMDNYGYSYFSEEQELSILDFYKTNSFNITLSEFDIKAFYLTYLLNKYSVSKHTQKQERQLSSLSLYGTMHPTQSIVVKEKQKNARENQSAEKKKAIEDKRHTTLMGRYGSISYNNREKAKRTSLEKYGVDNVFKSEYFAEKSKATKKELYGDENFTNRQKASETCLDKYGSETFLGSKTGQDTIKSYNQEKYGVDYAFQSKEWQTKELMHRKELYPNNYNNRHLAYKTCLDKYGVEYYCITDDCRNSGNGYRSKPNEYFAKLLEDKGIKYEREFKLLKYSYDFRIGNTLIEINPTITHTASLSIYDADYSKYKSYHKEKSQLAEENGFRCIHVWDWTNLDILLDIINPNKKKLYARKCSCRVIDKKIANSFIDENHLQGSCKGNIYNFGLYFNEQLVEIISFGKSRYDKTCDLELLRSCTLLGYIVIGGLEKLWKFALKNIQADKIVSYCDKSVFSGKSYLKLGFVYASCSVNKHWYNIKTKQHILDSYLNAQGVDRIFKTNYGKGTSNHDLMLQNGFLEVYDAGQAKYIFDNHIES